MKCLKVKIVAQCKFQFAFASYSPCNVHWFPCLSKAFYLVFNQSILIQMFHHTMMPNYTVPFCLFPLYVFSFIVTIYSSFPDRQGFLYLMRVSSFYWELVSLKTSSLRFLSVHFFSHHSFIKLHLRNPQIISDYFVYCP